MLPFSMLLTRPAIRPAFGLPLLLAVPCRAQGPRVELPRPGQPGGARQLQFVLINPVKNKEMKWQKWVINQSVPSRFPPSRHHEGYLPTKWGSVVPNAASLPSHHPQSLRASPVAGSRHKPGGGVQHRGPDPALQAPPPAAATQPQAAKPHVPAGAENPRLLPHTQQASSSVR